LLNPFSGTKAVTFVLSGMVTFPKYWEAVEKLELVLIKLRTSVAEMREKSDNRQKLAPK
jgi:hypothetical protein